MSLNFQNNNSSWLSVPVFLDLDVVRDQKASSALQYFQLKNFFTCLFVELLFIANDCRVFDVDQNCMKHFRIIALQKDFFAK